MITSDRQLKVTLSKIADLKASLNDKFPGVPEDFRQGALLN